VKDKRVVVLGWAGGCGGDIESLVKQRMTGWDMLVVEAFRLEQKLEEV